MNPFLVLVLVIDLPATGLFFERVVAPSRLVSFCTGLSG